MPRYRRRLSAVERTWLVADALCPPFVNQLVLEGRGDLDPERWGAAVARAAEVNPGSRVVLRGALWWACWVDTGRAPPVRVVPTPEWDGRSPRGAALLRDPLPVGAGPTTEVVLCPGPRPRVVVRTHHATMDGRGTLAFVDDVLRCLAGQAPVGAPDVVIDADLARGVPSPQAAPRREDCLAATGVPEGGADTVTWRRRTLHGRFSALLPRLALVIAAAARRHGEGRVRIDVPVDLRPAAEGVLSTANLTGMVHVEVAQDDTVETVAAAIRDAVARGDHAAFVRSLGVLRYVPLALMRWIARAGAARVLGRGRFICTAVLSNLGRFEVREAPGVFRADAAWFVPPGVHSLPFFVALCGVGDTLQLVAAAPDRLATGDRLDRLLAEVEDGLTRAPAGPGD